MSTWPNLLSMYLSKPRLATTTTLASDDDSLPFFHPECMRGDAERLLTQYHATHRSPCFLVRNSAYGDRLALSRSDAHGNLSHALILRVYPGYSVALPDHPRTVFATLVQLVASLDLGHGVPKENCCCTGVAASLSAPIVSCSQVIQQFADVLAAGTDVPQLHWALAVSSARPHGCTFVQFGAQEQVAGRHLQLDEPLIDRLCDALGARTESGGARRGVLEALRINGLYQGPSFACALSSEGARRLVRGLPLSGLVLLDLQVNRIDDAGADAIAQLMAQRSSLRAVDVRHNFITARGALSLQNAMCRNDALVRVNIWPQLYETQPMHEIAANPCKHLHAVCDVVEEALSMRTKLRSGELRLHGFLTHEQADALLKAGFYMTYLHAQHPLTVVVASMKSDAAAPSGAVVQRTFVRRAGNAYTTSSAPDRQLSLLQRSAWALLADAAVALAKAKAAAVGVHWTALPFGLVLHGTDDALAAPDARWSELPRSLRALLGGSALVAALWRQTEPLTYEQITSDVPVRPSGEAHTFEHILYRSRQGLLLLLEPRVQAPRVFQVPARTPKAMFKVNI